MSADILERLNTSWKGKLLESKETIAALKDRGITKVDRFADLELGLVEVPSPNRLPEKALQQLTSFGVIDHTLGGMVSVPLRGKDGRIVNYYFLSLNGSDPSAELALSVAEAFASSEAETPGTGDRIIRAGGIVNRKAFEVFKSLVVVDTMADYFAYFQGVKENVVPLIRSEQMPEDIAEALAISKVEELVLVNESPYWDILKTKISDTGVRVFEVALPEKKSLAQFLTGSSANRVLAYIEAEKAKQLKAAASRPGPAQAGDKSAAGDPGACAGPDRSERLTIIEEIGELRFTAHDRTYRVRGFNKDGFEKIVQVSLEVDGKTFPDKVDLSRSQGRMRFATIAGNEFETSADLIRDDLAFIYQTLDRIQDERFKAKAGIHAEDVHIVTPSEASKVIDLITKRDILDEMLLKDAERLGFVGEEINKKLYYLSATSRLTGKPLSTLVIASSGSGKSFGLSTIMSMMPPDEMLKYSRLSQHALYYKSEEELKGKVMYLEEIIGMEEALKSIRMLLSSGELAVSVVEKDPRTQTLKTVERRIAVDIPVLSSGVREVWDEESLSRFLVTYNDETVKHRERILKAQAYRYSLEGEKSHLYRERILKRHRDIQKVLDRNIQVVNPFAERIMVNPNLHIATRKQEQYLRIIYTIAFLRQFSKEKRQAVDKFGSAFTYVEVDEYDLETANEIASHVFQYARGTLSKRLAEAYQIIENYCVERVKEKRIALHEFRFSRREIREYSAWELTTAKRILDELESFEYIRRVRGSFGRTCLYSLVPATGTIGNLRDLKLFDPKKTI